MRWQRAKEERGKSKEQGEAECASGGKEIRTNNQSNNQFYQRGGGLKHSTNPGWVRRNGRDDVRGTCDSRFCCHRAAISAVYLLGRVQGRCVGTFGANRRSPGTANTVL